MKLWALCRSIGGLAHIPAGENARPPISPTPDKSMQSACPGRDGQQRGVVRGKAGTGAQSARHGDGGVANRAGWVGGGVFRGAKQATKVAALASATCA
jgi:hypothetical protein